jgi:hypothetical protein
VIPAFLLLFPLWRRDGRTLAGAALALAFGLVILPSLYWGLPQAIKLHEQMADAVLHPGLGQGGDQTRAKELTEVTATDNQSFQATFHNYQYWGRLMSRPGQPAAWARQAHWLLSGVLAMAILLASGWKPDNDPVRCLMLLGSLFLLMTLVTPVSHLHYFSMALPLVMALIAATMQGRPGALLPRPLPLCLLLLVGVGYLLPSIPLWEGRREAGLPMFVSLFLIGISMAYVWRQRRRQRAVPSTIDDRASSDAVLRRVA